MTQKYLSTVARGDDDKSSPTGNNFLTLSILDLILTSIYSEREARKCEARFFNSELRT